MSLDRKRALILLGIATVAFTVILELIDPSHVSHGATILDFEFARTQRRAAQIMAEWGGKGRSAAHLSLVLDYGYMLSYGLFFASRASPSATVRGHGAGDGSRPAAPSFRSSRSRLRFLTQAKTSLSC